MHGRQAEHAEHGEAGQLAAIDPEQVGAGEAEDEQQDQEGAGGAQLRETCGVDPVVQEVAGHAPVQREERGTGGGEHVPAGGVPFEAVQRATPTRSRRPSAPGR